MGAVNGGGRLIASSLRSCAAEDGSLTVYLPGEDDMPSGSSSMNYSVLSGQSGSSVSGDGVITLKGINANYDLRLVGWYNIDTGEYYDVTGISGGMPVTVSLLEENVFYADYIPASYDFGTSSDSNLVSTVSTDDLVSVRLFDYNELFNLYSTSVERIITNNSGYNWNENWHDSGSLHDVPNATDQTHDDTTEFDDDEFTSRGNVINSSLLFRSVGANSLLYVTEPADWNGGAASVFQDAGEVWGIPRIPPTEPQTCGWYPDCRDEILEEDVIRPKCIAFMPVKIYKLIYIYTSREGCCSFPDLNVLILPAGRGILPIPVIRRPAAIVRIRGEGKIT